MLLLCVTTVFSAQSLPFRGPARDLGPGDLTAFERGLTLFRKAYTAPEGLGPEFNAVSCASCHDTPVAGGSGRAPTTFVDWTYTDPSDALGAPGHRFVTARGGEIATIPSNTDERRRTPPLFGLGQLEAFAIEDLRSRDDPFDVDGDGISGRLPWRDDCFGRFGWQSTMCDVRTFVIGALTHELGIVSLPRARREISNGDVADLAAFVRSLAPQPAAQSQDGADLFERALCSRCHAPLTGIARSAGSQVKVRAYTDLLIHEMRSGRRHGEQDSRTEFRTAPLWALRQRDRPIFTMAPPQRSKKPYSCTAARPNIRGVGSRASVVLKSSNCCGS